MTASTVDVRGVRVAITGASSGLGYAMARALTAQGAHVVIGSRHDETLDRTVRALRAGSGTITAARLDVRDTESVERFMDVVERTHHGLDVLINNAGLGMRSVNPGFMFEPQPFWEVSPDGFRAVIETNLTGYFLMARAVVTRFFLPSRAGKIVNVTMNHETMRRQGFVPYGPSRAGAEALSEIMGADLATLGVSVNLLLPGGATLTGMIPDEVPDAVRSRLLPPQVMERPVRFLASSASDGITGARIVARDFAGWCAERELILEEATL